MVAVPPELFGRILARIAKLRPPDPALCWIAPWTEWRGAEGRAAPESGSWLPWSSGIRRHRPRSRLESVRSPLPSLGRQSVASGIGPQYQDAATRVGL